MIDAAAAKKLSDAQLRFALRDLTEVMLLAIEDGREISQRHGKEFVVVEAELARRAHSPQLPVLVQWEDGEVKLSAPVMVF